MFVSKLIEFLLISLILNKKSTETNGLDKLKREETSLDHLKRNEEIKLNISYYLEKHTKDVKISHYPFMVSIQQKFIHKCCGTIVSRSWILTAAHCLTIAGPKLKLISRVDLTITAGRTNLGVGYNQIVRIKEIYIHSGFVKKMLLNDIGVLNLYQRLVYNSNVRPISLTSTFSKEYHTFDTCYIISWKFINQDYFTNRENLDNMIMENKTDENLPVLQKIELPTIKNEKCEALIEAKEFLNEKQICTLFGTFKKIACGSDAGSPLICADDKQYGIFSWGIGCDDEIYPGVFTRVGYFKDWIDSLKRNPYDYIKSDHNDLEDLDLNRHRHEHKNKVEEHENNEHYKNNYDDKNYYSFIYFIIIIIINVVYGMIFI